MGWRGEVGLLVVAVAAAVAMPALDPSDNILPGVSTLPTQHSTREAEPHALEDAMNTERIVADWGDHVVTGHAEAGRGDNDDGCGDRQVMDAVPDVPVRETAESMNNGERNEAIVALRREENARLPAAQQHKTLTQIWKMETPCECPFNVWKPVCGQDGKTYPTECFAQCINMPIFFHSDCRYVRKELWAREQEKLNEGKIPVDEFEACEEGDDDADDPRAKCRRKAHMAQVQRERADAQREQAIAPFAEEDNESAPLADNLVQLPNTPIANNDEPQDETDHEDHVIDAAHLTPPEPEPTRPDIQYRVFQGVRVPYFTGDVENPCPACALGYTPCCGVDGKTYPSACWAECAGVEVAKDGECA